MQALSLLCSTFPLAGYVRCIQSFNSLKKKKKGDLLLRLLRHLLNNRSSAASPLTRVADLRTVELIQTDPGLEGFRKRGEGSVPLDHHSSALYLFVSCTLQHSLSILYLLVLTPVTPRQRRHWDKPWMWHWPMPLRLCVYHSQSFISPSPLPPPHPLPHISFILPLNKPLPACLPILTTVA